MKFNRSITCAGRLFLVSAIASLFACTPEVKPEGNKDNVSEDICCCTTSKAVIEYNTAVIKSGGDSQVFVGKFYDEKENEVVDIVPHWNVVCDFRDKLIMKEFDKSLSIGIDEDDYIDEEFTIILSDNNSESDILPYTLLVKVESLL